MLDKLIELFVESRYPVIAYGGLVLLIVDPLHELIDQFHDEIVIVATLAILETEAVIGVVEEVVLECLDVVYLLYLALQRLVDHHCLSHGELGQQVRRHSILNVVVYHLDLVRVEMQGLVEADDIADDVLRTIYLGLVVTHLALLEVVEGSRQHLRAQVGYPLLQVHLLDLPSLQDGQLEDHLPVSGLDLVGLVELVHLLQQFLEGAQEQFELSAHSFLLLAIPGSVGRVGTIKHFLGGLRAQLVLRIGPIPIFDDHLDDAVLHYCSR